jgi:hypothetical protein
MSKKVIVTDIEYDTDEVDVDLPTTLEIEVPSEFIDEEEICEFVSEEISNITGFCHNGFVIN